MTKLLVVIISVVALTSISNPTFADPDTLQELCVADLASAVKVKGFPCKATFSACDFFSPKLVAPGSTSDLLGYNATQVNVNHIPGLNALGIHMVHINYAPGGLNLPHIHPRATEIVFVLQGQLNVGFITTTNVLVSKTIKADDVFAFQISTHKVASIKKKLSP